MALAATIYGGGGGHRAEDARRGQKQAEAAGEGLRKAPKGLGQAVGACAPPPDPEKLEGELPVLDLLKRPGQIV
jgi:hypothetical protein